MNPTSLLRHFRITTRMNGAVLIVLAMFAVIGATGLVGGARLKTLNTAFMNSAIGQARAVADVRAALAEVRRSEKDMVIEYEDGVAVLKLRERWAESIKTTQSAFERLAQGDHAETTALAREAAEQLGAYAKASDPVLQQIQNGGFDTAKVADRMLARAKSHVVVAEERVNKIAELVSEQGTAAQREFDASMQRLMFVFGAVLVVIVGLVVLLTLLNSRSITRPIEHARQVAQAIASGDLCQAIESEGQDEASDLLRALDQMQSSLRQLVGQVRSSTDSISTASAEIATGNQDLSMRTEQTASNLQQAAASMEQLTGTVAQSADSARQANRLAVDAAQVAGRGGVVVSQVVGTMDEITASSKQIADIIGVIDGIAFQTNILALNAAVEAARAGEQGRGFAVVASEVRSLAQRSAQAAREIKVLIGASVDKVESGSRLVAAAGQTMQEIVESVRRVSDIVGEITTASAEQSNGIGQMHQSVSQLDQMTQQNAALVEQSAAAAESLQGQTVRLASLVAVFKLGSGQLAHA